MKRDVIENCASAEGAQHNYNYMSLYIKLTSHQLNSHPLTGALTTSI